MFVNLNPNEPSGYFTSQICRGNSHTSLLFRAIDRFNRAFAAGRLRYFWARLGRILGLRRLNGLIRLGDLPLKLTGSSYAGPRAVLIADIRGTEGRVEDFDNHFYPLDERLRDRWQSIAMARAQGIGLPPVELVQVGRFYFVRDGHHRLSVARALGEEVIDAVVTVLRVEGPLPWEGKTGLKAQGANRPEILVTRKAGAYGLNSISR